MQISDMLGNLKLKYWDFPNQRHANQPPTSDKKLQKE